QLDSYLLEEMHELLLGPFTSLPFVHLKDLLYNQSNSLININGHFIYSNKNECSCFKEIYFCGFKTNNITLDGKMLPHSKSSHILPLFDVNGGYSWDMSRY